MKEKPMKNLTLVIAVSAPLLADVANGDVLFDVAGSTIQTHFAGDYSNGNEFTLSNPLTIYGLAYIDAEGDGLQISHEVTLWDTSDQSLVANATVNPTDSFSASTNGVSRWYESPITTTILDPGTYRVVGLYGDPAPDSSLDEFPTSSVPGVSLPSGYWRNEFPGGGTSYPDLSFTTQRIAANVVTSPVAVIPEPGSTSAILAILALTATQRRRR